MLLCPPSEENMKREPSPLTSDFHSGSTVTSPPLTDIRKNDASSLQPVSTVCIPPCLRRKPPCSHHRLAFGASKSKALPSPTGQDTKARNLEPSLTPFFHHFAPPSKPSVPLVLPTFTPSPATSFLSAQPSPGKLPELSHWSPCCYPQSSQSIFSRADRPRHMRKDFANEDELATCQLIFI